MEPAPISENAAQVNNAAPPRGRGGRVGRGAQNGQVGHGGSAGAATVQGNPNPNGFAQQVGNAQPLLVPARGGTRGRSRSCGGALGGGRQPGTQNWSEADLLALVGYLETALDKVEQTGDYSDRRRSTCKRIAMPKVIYLYAEKEWSDIGRDEKRVDISPRQDGGR